MQHVLTSVSNAAINPDGWFATQNPVCAQVIVFVGHTTGSLLGAARAACERHDQNSSTQKACTGIHFLNPIYLPKT
jgi:hypothetical protein